MNRVEYFNIEQGSKAWFNIRMGLFTSSKISDLFRDPKTKKDKEAGLLSQTAKTYVEQKACELIYLTPTDGFSSTPTDWGNKYEPYACEAYQQTTGNELKKIGFVTLGQDTGTSPDRYSDNNGLAEIKCPFNRVNHIKNSIYLNTAKDLLKHNKEYYLQVQHQLYVTGREWCDFVSFDPRLLDTDNWRKCIHIIKIERDDSLDFKGRIQMAADYRDYILKQIIES